MPPRSSGRIVARLGVDRGLHHLAVAVFHLHVVSVWSPATLTLIRWAAPDPRSPSHSCRGLRGVDHGLHYIAFPVWRGVDHGLYRIPVAVFHLHEVSVGGGGRTSSIFLIRTSCSQSLEPCCLACLGLVGSWPGVVLTAVSVTLPSRSFIFTKSALGAQESSTFLLRWLAPDPRLDHGLAWC